MNTNVISVKFGENAYYNIETEDASSEIDFDLKDNAISDSFTRLLRGEKLAKTDEEIQKIAEVAIKQIEVQLNENTITKTHKVAIKKIFKESGLTNLSRGRYDPDKKEYKGEFNRGSIKEGSKIEQILMPELKQKRKDVADAISRVQSHGRTEDNLLAVEATLLELLATEFLFVQKLGVELERNKDGGSGGARYAFDRLGRKILVDKPDDEGPNKQNNPQGYSKIKNLFVSPKRCLDGNSEVLAEERSYILDRKFGFRVVPPTKRDYVYSRDFKFAPDFQGEKVKLCSMQAFVENCQPLGQYIGVPPFMHSLPRWFLNWWIKREKVEIEVNGEKKWVPKILLKIPDSLLRIIATHNGLSEDIDCHFENILVKVHQNKDTNLLLQAIFKDSRSRDIPYSEIDNFVSNLFEKKGHQALLDLLLLSEENRLGEKISLFKHDGGSSFPNDHPTGYLSTRFKGLFEVFPHFDNGAPFKGFEKLIEKEERLESLLADQAVQSLRSIMEPQFFANFWASKENRQLFKSWIFDSTKKAEESLLTRFLNWLFGLVHNIDENFHKSGEFDLISELMKATNQANQTDEEMKERYKRFFSDHLGFIRGSIQTRIDSWRVMKAFAVSGRPMRDFFRGVRTKKDFERELANLTNDKFEESLKVWHKRPVLQNEVKYGKEDVISSKDLLRDLGINA